MELIKPDINFDFTGKRKIAFLISFICIAVSVLSLIINGGLRYGVDFSGGSQLLLSFQQDINSENLNTALESMGLDNSSIQESRSGQNFLFQIRTSKAISSESGILDILPKHIKDYTGADTEILSLDIVGPQVSQDLRSKAMYAIFYALLFIMVYISGRFEAQWFLSGAVALVFTGTVYLFPQLMENFFKVSLPVSLLVLIAMMLTLAVFWKLKLAYALGAVVALIHDVIITIGCFSILKLEFNLSTVAAILTIIGYSLNDTIIIFDRVRENIPSRDKKTFTAIPESIINKSINSTLSRTLLTSGTTLTVLVALFFLGGGVIHDFSRALLIGVIVGTYSSIFIASPFLLLWEKKTE